MIFDSIGYSISEYLKMINFINNFLVLTFDF